MDDGRDTTSMDDGRDTTLMDDGRWMMGDERWTRHYCYGCTSDDLYYNFHELSAPVVLLMTGLVTLKKFKNCILTRFFKVDFILIDA